MMARMHDSPTHGALAALTPVAPDWRIDWAAIWALWPELPALDACPQDPIHHAEGDAGLHTRMVVEALVEAPAWRELATEDRTALFWAAVLHDVGKPACTRTEAGRITSRGHSRAGALIARQLLWAAASPFLWRETICGIIATHQSPFWLIEREDPTRMAIETSWRCRPGLLHIHARADATGRICADQQAILDNVALSEVAFDEAGCLDRAYPFANDESRMAYFERPGRAPDHAAILDHRCRVTVLSGLPGAGKDTWLGAHEPDLPVISLDAIRAELGVAPTANQGRVVQAAQELAREHLRAGRDFAWNATNTTRQMRQRVIRLLRDYDAWVHIVYLEPSPDILHRRNRDRTDFVPDAVIQRLAATVEPPGWDEAHQISHVIGSPH